MRKILTIGGGTGSHVLLSGLKKFVHEGRGIELSAIVTVADDGGSTGRLRDAYGYLPVGDFRMALCALAHDEGQELLLRDLFQYRFNKGDVKGHNFGNLFLTALTDMLGSEEAALAAAGKLLRADGEVIPVSGEQVVLCAEFEDGTTLCGEHVLDDLGSLDINHGRILRVFTEEESHASRFAIDAILAADVIVLGPGDLYTSTIANLVVGGVGDALCRSSAKIVVLPSLMTKAGQTDGMGSREWTEELEKYIGRPADVVIVNSSTLPKDLLENYATEKEFPIVDNFGDDARVIRADILAPIASKKNNSDTVKRSLLRHDPAKTAEIIRSLA
jgi:uncharacterized cofD-like protein